MKVSERPSSYTFAVSMKLTPPSKAAAITRSDSASSICPPKLSPPMQYSETLRPVLPSLTYSMGFCVGFRPVRMLSERPH